MLTRRYCAIEVRGIDADKRTISGIASTSTEDRYGDIVEPTGARFSLPLPLIWQHNAREPVGNVTAAKAVKTGIEFTASFVKPGPDAPQSWADRLNSAWADVSSGLVRFVSIGFNSIKHSYIDGTFGIHFEEWEWLELSPVTIPANPDASIDEIKRHDERVLRALQGNSTQRRAGVRLLHPSAEGRRTPITRTARGAVLLNSPGGKKS